MSGGTVALLVLSIVIIGLLILFQVRFRTATASLGEAGEAIRYDPHDDVGTVELLRRLRTSDVEFSQLGPVLRVKDCHGVWNTVKPGEYVILVRGGATMFSFLGTFFTIMIVGGVYYDQNASVERTRVSAEIGRKMNAVWPITKSVAQVNDYKLVVSGPLPDVAYARQGTVAFISGEKKCTITTTEVDFNEGRWTGNLSCEGNHNDTQR